jgi:UDP-glucose:(heptosyl)LPS alpha-1,3-glucosyltransferase
MSDVALPVALVRRGYSSSGGAEAYLLRLAGGLKNRGCEVTLYTSEDWPEERWTFGPLVRLKGRTPQKFAEAFAEARDPNQAILTLDRVPGCEVFRAGDGVHAAWLYRRGLFEPKWRKFLHLLNPKHLSMMRLECEVFQSVRQVIANSAMVADEIVRWHDFPRERIHVVPNGIGRPVPAMRRDEARRKLDLPADTFCILFVGTGWERKGLKFAIRAVENLGNAILLVAGRGPAHKYPSSSTRFLGPVSDLSALFSAADVFTLPTIYDPFSNACLEALAAGRPVVTTRANGFSEIITPGVHGDVVEAGNVDALADALAPWNGRNREQVTQACQTLAADYTIERNVNATLAVLGAAAGLP